MQILKWSSTEIKAHKKKVMEQKVPKRGNGTCVDDDLTTCNISKQISQILYNIVVNSI